MWRLAAVLSLLAAATASAALRPRYGGTLRVEMRPALDALDPAATGAAASRLLPLVFDRLVRIDSQGLPRPALAVSWSRDADARRWRFRLRTGVRFHDGTPLAPGPTVAAAFQSVLRDFKVAASGDSLLIDCPRPEPGLLLELGRRGYLFSRTAEGAATGTGPFRPVRIEPGRHASFTANDEYWDGRPFLDGIEVDMGRASRDQLIALDVGRADVIEPGVGDFRRAAANGRSVWSSAPTLLLALVFHDGRPSDPRLREALALAIDRAAIHNVLLQRRGEVSGGVLPQWLSGYAFLFPASADVPRARGIAAQAAAPARSATLAWDASEPLTRTIAERIAVNARDAGISVQVAAPGARADARLAAIRIASLDPAQALVEVAAAAGFGGIERQPSLESLYSAERLLLDNFRVVPLFHLPEEFVAAPRVKSWSAPVVSRIGEWQFADVWLDGGRP